MFYRLVLSFESMLLSVIAVVVRYKFYQLKMNLWRSSLRKNILMKLIHLRYILTSKAKVLHFSLRLNTYNLILLSHTYLYSFISGSRRLIQSPCMAYGLVLADNSCRLPAVSFCFKELHLRCDTG